ncbi:MAG: type II toxin-antitoxin system VapC family toxin [Spirochaetia bacterium]|nr:type II toxin-antitoxin system VapC family toxin [Spirochaetia bacterium]
MNEIYILDACALIASLANEPGAKNVRKILQDAIDEKAIVKMNQINLLEVYYDIYRTYGKDEANKVLEKIQKFPIEIIIGMTEEVFKTAGLLKSKYKISLADSIALGESIIGNASLVTSDHHEFETIKKTENINITWFR